jgi:phosphate uptake regulator
MISGGAYTDTLEGLFSRDPALCEKVIEAHKEMDELEVRIDQAFIDLLLTRQPVAKDLRFVLDMSARGR